MSGRSFRALLMLCMAALVLPVGAGASGLVRRWRWAELKEPAEGTLTALDGAAVEIYDFPADRYMRVLLADLSQADRSYVERNRRTLARLAGAWDACLQPAGRNGTADRAGGILRDRFGRDATARGVVLLDWEGHIGNPEVEYTITPPAGLRRPVKLEMRTRGAAPLLYFIDGRGVLMSEHDANGPRLKHVFEEGSGPLRTRLAVQPDPDGRGERYELLLEFRGADGRRRTVTVPVAVCDQDCDRPADFRFIVDTSHDETGFYKAHPEAAEELRRIAADVAYYLDDQGFDEVPAGGATAPVNFRPRKEASNPRPFRGFYLFSTGWRHGTEPQDIWSTGYPGRTRARRGGKELPVYCVGAVRPHPDGDRSAKNTAGWSFFRDDRDWWKISRMRKRPDGTECYHVSFYSVQKHELLHALAYEPRYPLWRAFADELKITDRNVMAYTGRATPIRKDRAHAWDPVLHRRQWNQGVEMLDKFELLVMQAVGWRLRLTTPFVPLAVVGDALPAGRVGRPYAGRVRIVGGVPPLRFAVVRGGLPEGLRLDEFTGAITGSPAGKGEFSFTVQVNDAGPDNSVRPNGTKRRLRITVR